jgi:hypothetical protein
MPADLVGAKLPLNNPLLSLLGGLSNVAQANVPARSNLEYPVGNLSDGALAATGIAAIVPCPVDPGTVVSKVSILVGATAGATITHGFAALYAGTGTAPALIGQSTDIGTTSAITASTAYSFTLTTAQLITNALAPQNFVYVAIVFAQSAGTIPTVVSASTPTGVNYQYETGSPLFLSATAGSGLTTTAASTIATASAKAVAPIVVLS